MYASAQTKLTPLRRFLSVAPVLALAVIVANAVVSQHSAVSPRPMPIAAAAADGLASPDAAATVAVTPRELVTMEAAGLVMLARPMPAPQLRPAWQGGAGYRVWGDCTDPFARQAAPELCG